MMVRYAGFWVRFIANLLDVLLLTVVSWVLEYALLGVFYGILVLVNRSSGVPVPTFSQAFNPLFEQLFSAGLYACLAFPYYVWGHFRWGTTLGKLPFGIRVVSFPDHGPIGFWQANLRCVAYALSYLPMAAGFLMAAFHPQKRCLHDLLAGTCSIRVEKA